MHYFIAERDLDNGLEECRNYVSPKECCRTAV